MATVAYETKNAVFQFDLNDTVSYLENYSQEHNISEASEILRFIKSSNDNISPSLRISKVKKSLSIPIILFARIQVWYQLVQHLLSQVG